MHRKVATAVVAVCAALLATSGAAVAAPATLSIDLTGPGVEWTDIDQHEEVSGCTSLRNKLATDSFLPGYGPDDANTDTTDGFDTYGLVTIDGTYFSNPDDSVDQTGETVTSDTVPMSGVDVTVQHSALQAVPVLRTLVQLANTSGNPVTKVVTFEQDLGSDDDTFVQTTSSGDDTWTVADRWVLTTEDETPEFSDPPITTAFYGPGTLASPPTSLDLCGEEWANVSSAQEAQGKVETPTTESTDPVTDGAAPTTTTEPPDVAPSVVGSEAAQTSRIFFSVTIPAGESRYLAFFNSATTNEELAPAQAITPLYDAGLTGALVEGLDPAIVPLVVNWSEALVARFTG